MKLEVLRSQLCYKKKNEEILYTTNFRFADEGTPPAIYVVCNKFYAIVTVPALEAYKVSFVQTLNNPAIKLVYKFEKASEEHTALVEKAYEVLSTVLDQ